MYVYIHIPTNRAGNKRIRIGKCKSIPSHVRITLLSALYLLPFPAKKQPSACHSQTVRKLKYADC